MPLGRLTVAMCVLVLVLPLAAQRHPDALPYQHIIVLKDDTPNPRGVANEMASRHGLGLLYVYEHALKGFAATVPDAALRGLRNDPRVKFISEDRLVTAFAQTTPTGVNRIKAVNKMNKGAGVHVAVIDSGINSTHPDLQANVAGGVNCSTGSSYEDGNGHGSHVAGTIAGLDNGIGVVGVAPQAKLWAVRVLNNAGSGSWSSVICGVNWVTANKIQVANMSLGGSGSDDGNCGNTNQDALHQAICNSVAVGVTYVVAAGNSSKDLKDSVPAAYDEVITVTALSDSNGAPCGGGSSTDDTWAGFSNFATLASDLAHTVGAPGVGIYSTYKNGGYATLSGTSMSAPHVAGLAALYKADNPTWSPAQVLAALKANAEDFEENFGNECSGATTSHTGSSTHPEPVVRADGFANSDGGGGCTAPSTPALSATAVSFSQINLSWSDSDSETSYQIYRCEGSACTPSALIASPPANATGHSDTGLAASTPYRYLVRALKEGCSSTDSNNAEATTQSVGGGGETLHVGDLDGSGATHGNGNNWTATVTVAIHSSTEAAVSSATVSGAWSTGGTSSCITNGAGTCTVSKGGLKANSTASVTFTVSGVTHATLSYDATANHDPDGDSTGTLITVNNP